MGGGDRHITVPCGFCFQVYSLASLMAAICFAASFCAVSPAPLCARIALTRTLPICLMVLYMRLRWQLHSRSTCARVGAQRWGGSRWESDRQHARRTSPCRYVRVPCADWNTTSALSHTSRTCLRTLGRIRRSSPPKALGTSCMKCSHSRFDLIVIVAPGQWRSGGRADCVTRGGWAGGRVGGQTGRQTSKEVGEVAVSRSYPRVPDPLRQNAEPPWAETQLRQLVHMVEDATWGSGGRLGGWTSTGQSKATQGWPSA